MRRDIASTARVAVVIPRPAYLFTAFDDHEVFEAGLTQLNRHTQATRACTDNCDREIFGIPVGLILFY